MRKRGGMLLRMVSMSVMIFCVIKLLSGCGGESKNNPTLTSSQGDVKIFDPEKVPFINSRGEHGYFARQELPDFADPQKVVSFYGRAKVADLGTFNGTVQNDKAGTYHTFTVPSGSTSLNVKLSWPKPTATDDIDLHLINPNGKEYAWDKATTGYSGYDVNPEWFAIPNPVAGQWKAFAYGYAITSASSSTYTMTANVEQPDTSQPPAGGGGGATPSNFSGSVDYKKWWSGTITVPSGSSNLKVSVSWSGNSDLDLHLYSPSGKGYGYAEDSTGYNGFWKNPEEITLSNPASGTWTVKMYGYAVPTSIGSQSFSGTVTITTSGTSGGPTPDQSWTFDSNYNSNLKGVKVKLEKFIQSSTSNLYRLTVESETVSASLSKPYYQIIHGATIIVTDEALDVYKPNTGEIQTHSINDYSWSDYNPVLQQWASFGLDLATDWLMKLVKYGGEILNVTKLVTSFQSNIEPSSTFKGYMSDYNNYDLTSLATYDGLGTLFSGGIRFSVVIANETTSKKPYFFLKFRRDTYNAGVSGADPDLIALEFLGDFSKPTVVFQPNL